MSEEKDQQNLYQNQTSWNWWSDLIKEDWWLLNWNATSEEWKENSKKRFDLLWSTYEDSIRNSNLDWNKNDKNLPKTYPWKKWRNAWAIVLIVDLVLSMLWLFSFILELISTILMVIFLILWIKTIRTPENQEIIKDNSYIDLCLIANNKVTYPNYLQNNQLIQNLLQTNQYQYYYLDLHYL